MNANLRAYEMVEGTTPEEAGLMKQQRRIEEAQRLRRQRQAASGKPADQQPAEQRAAGPSRP